MFEVRSHRPQVREPQPLTVKANTMNIKPQAKKSSLLANAAGTKASLKAPVNGFGALRSVLEKACTMAECGLSDLTVLSAQVDPYRLDTPSGHRDGKWLPRPSHPTARPP